MKTDSITSSGEEIKKSLDNTRFTLDYNSEILKNENCSLNDDSELPEEDDVIQYMTEQYEQRKFNEIRGLYLKEHSLTLYENPEFTTNVKKILYKLQFIPHNAMNNFYHLVHANHSVDQLMAYANIHPNVEVNESVLEKIYVIQEKIYSFIYKVEQEQREYLQTDLKNDCFTKEQDILEIRSITNDLEEFYQLLIDDDICDLVGYNEEIISPHNSLRLDIHLL